MAKNETDSNTTDDRGNVVDIYSGGSRTARIDREGGPIPGLDFEYGYGWIGGPEEMAIAIKAGYSLHLAVAIICGMLRSDPEASEASEDARNFYTAFVNS